MPLDAAGLRSISRSEGFALLDQLERLPDDRWAAPTACAGWDVLDVLVHLGLGTELSRQMVENALVGKVEPPFELPAGADPLDVFKQANDRERARGPAANVTTLREALDRYVNLLTAVDDAALERRAWHFSGRVTLRRVIEGRAYDLVVHAADVRRAVGIEPWFSAAGGRFAGDYALGSLSRIFVAGRAGGARGAILQTIDGAPSQATLGESGLTIGRPDGKHVASLATDGGTWSLLTWGRMAPAEAESRGLLTVEGDRELVERYLGALASP